ncbi:unnamed protein product [Echinostoma caproni]|uniref:Uncharacterized protein n=1 Tax=Echinostoma caproni TaxID=27848 RepID=A0A183ANF3_9TREM|nr:unnamed protein product [Echinostoma caproni]
MLACLLSTCALSSQSHNVGVLTNRCIHGVMRRQFTLRLTRAELDKTAKSKFRRVLSRDFTITFVFTADDCSRCAGPITPIGQSSAAPTEETRATGSKVTTTGNTTSPSRSGLASLAATLNFPASLSFVHTRSLRGSSHTKTAKPENVTSYEKRNASSLPKRRSSDLGQSGLVHHEPFRSADTTTPSPSPLQPSVPPAKSLVAEEPSSDEEVDTTDEEEDEEVDVSDPEGLGSHSAASDPAVETRSNTTGSQPYASCLTPPTSSLSLNAIDQARPTKPATPTVPQSRSMVHFSRYSSLQLKKMKTPGQQSTTANSADRRTPFVSSSDRGPDNQSAPSSSPVRHHYSRLAQSVVNTDSSQSPKKTTEDAYSRL